MKRLAESMWQRPSLWEWWVPLAWLAALLGMVLAIPWLEDVFRQIAPNSRSVIYQRNAFLTLVVNHMAIVGVASLVAIIAGVGAAVMVTRSWGRDFLPLVAQLASMGQTFPPVAVLALSVPMLGFGTEPTIVALVLYGLLPIVRNTLVGLQGIDADVLEAARGMGMSGGQVLWQVEFPLALTVIVAGIRTSVTINIATAAIGSTIGAKTLGEPIIAGIVNGNTAYILQGALLIALLALCVDSAFERVSRHL
ncbi:osmoprotectant uptake system permease [Litchfieldella qijiaojingensis]|uniref:Osmoprotectant uptake system permease n=1 Tax=Litchfieldella qijiaojingensis TaxID=980347 RepID=A0ABQ2YAS6_9GAMM|nr:ABC transporter permease [Halomonas qijiaojingensis]GGX78311.1 osmoprotectant uptake system permease [Halomonas qijiaojingensis]